MENKYPDELKFLKGVVINAYDKYIKNTPKMVDRKYSKNYGGDFVTNCDLAVEQYLIQEIKKHYPNDNIVSEENNPNKECVGRCWVIDPIDGTVDFSRDIPMWCIQTAFVVDGECQLAVIYCPTIGELYEASADGLYVNGKKTTINDSVPVQDSIVNFCDIFADADKFKYQNSIICGLAPKVMRIKVFGSAGFEFSFVASNKIQAYVLITNNVWDITPGKYICQVAGAEIIESKFGDTKVTIACNSHALAEEFKRLL